MIRRRVTERANHQGLAVAALVAGALVIGGCLSGLGYAFGVLRGIWLEQFRVEDRDVDVAITTKTVHPDVITLHFGLTNGANLATLPFGEWRTTLLEKQPKIRDVKIERRLPNRVVIDVVEREPVARIGPVKGRVRTGHVADFAGVVFSFAVDVETLPLIREPSDPLTQPGKRLPPPVLAALRLLEALSQPELADLRVLEIATNHPDYLMLTLGDYSRARIAWDHMLEDSRRSRESLRRQLTRLVQAIGSRASPRTTLWTATDYGTPGRVYASDAAPLGH
ncbi:MAG: cell division protein FtsQ/DivIB [Kiritimatiellia bacterium]